MSLLTSKHGSLTLILLKKKVKEAIADISKGDLNDLIAGAKILLQLITGFQTNLKTVKTFKVTSIESLPGPINSLNLKLSLRF